jgi:hypothetical protein
LKSFAELKRRIVVGSVLRMTSHSHAAILGRFADMVGRDRRVGVVQGNAIAFGAEGCKRSELSWLYWPAKAADVRLTGPHSFEVRYPKPGQSPAEMRIAYEIVNEAAAAAGGAV